VQLDIERRLAIAELLAQPDPPDIRRGHRQRFEGKPERYDLVPQLSAVFVQAKLLALQERRSEVSPAGPAADIVSRAHPELRKVLVAA
jgi:hypothetical protein